ncbi:IMV membrane protein virion maturation [Western grey kangaroopox virus]|uniref:IMV membrane protein virion maturation n=2 Tax=Macropopoxvirus TaxID=2733295 RepID=A0A2C9DT81_9POXV|nr:IMV membrane protein virion maturation [Western grey kangaroopox virus]YP_010085404.1 IMV membrane protein virion maturation [Eastern grey kangaroopox virus]ATI21050.1 IMV membrane protein virion maturation [Western grey kangaroopox virus]ATI21214.1 IMV membrane protein virion maturation [Eastern grey kangaroopox virus]ATX75120.1 IMV membrane protein, virion maturation [Eastern grey kangaroopox virus]
MGGAELVIFVVSAAIICMLIYTVYKRRQQPSPKLVPPQEEVADALFKDSLSPEQIRAMHRLMTSSRRSAGA